MLVKLKAILNVYKDEDLEDMSLWVNGSKEVTYLLIDVSNIDLITSGVEVKINGYTEQEKTD